MTGRRGARLIVIGLVGVAALVIVGSDTFAGTYRWIDRDGNIRYTDRPPQPDQIAAAPSGVPSSETPGAASATIDELMDLSGLRQQLEWMAVNTRSQIQALLGSLGAEERASVDRVAAVAFGADHLQALVRANLAAHTDDAKAAEALVWFRTPAGRKISAAETAAGMPQAQAAIAAFARARATNPTEPKRLERLRRVDEIAGTSEFSLDAVVAVAEGMQRGAEPFVPVERRRATAAMDRDVADARANAVEEFRAVTLVSLEFAYRDIDDADLDAYVGFLSAPAGRWFTGAVHQALLHAVRTSTEEAIVAIAQVIPQHEWGQIRRPMPSAKPTRL